MGLYWHIQQRSDRKMNTTERFEDSNGFLRAMVGIYDFMVLKV